MFIGHVTKGSCTIVVVFCNLLRPSLTDSDAGARRNAPPSNNGLVEQQAFHQQLLLIMGEGKESRTLLLHLFTR